MRNNDNSGKKTQNAGFTIVEVIVVAAIVAILAAVAIPIYTGFIRDSRQEAVSNLAQTAAAAANTYSRKIGAALPDDVEHSPNTPPLNLFFDATKFRVVVDGNNIVVTYIPDVSITATVAYR